MSQSPSLGKYEILREIARSNDIVWEAYDPVMNRRIALKELNFPHGLSESDREMRIERFTREARAGGKMNHPNIVTVYDTGQLEGRHYIAMELLDGNTLQQEIKKVGKLDPNRALEIAIAAASALQYTHSQGVVHRDIKPANIQLMKDGRVKLTDFGIALDQANPQITRQGEQWGTPSYMSPEQVKGVKADHRSDIFSLGSVIYEMFLGEKAFPGEVYEAAAAITSKEPTRMAELPPAVGQVVAKALSKIPDHRYSSMKEMESALVEVKNNPYAGMASFDLGTQQPFGQYPAPPPQPGWAQPPPPPTGYPSNPQVFNTPPPVQPPAYPGQPPQGNYTMPGTQYTGTQIPYVPRQKTNSALDKTSEGCTTGCIWAAILSALVVGVIIFINTSAMCVGAATAGASEQQAEQALSRARAASTPEDQIAYLATAAGKFQAAAEGSSGEQRTELEAKAFETYIQMGRLQMQMGDLIGADLTYQNAERFVGNHPDRAKQVQNLRNRVGSGLR
ncbi:MAG: serine/threonine protein kinase [Fimbriimonadaceae bacterium]